MLVFLILELAFWIFIIRLVKKALRRAKKQTQAGQPEPAVSARLRQDDEARKKEGKPPVTAASPAWRKKEQPSGEQGGSGLTHTLEDSFTSGHSHEETSMTGFAACPPEPEHEKEETPAPAKAEEASLEMPSLTKEEIMKAVLYHEILSGPKALRR